MLKLPATNAVPMGLNVANLFKYQPFELPDGRLTGCALAYTHGSATRMVDPRVDSAEVVADFLAANRRLAAM